MPTDLKPSAATNAGALDGTERVPCTQGGQNRALTPAQVATYISTVALPLLTVDNLGLNGNTYSSTSGDVLIAPASGVTSLIDTSFRLLLSGQNRFYVDGDGSRVRLRSTGILTWSPDGDAATAPDTSVGRSAAGVLIDGDANGGLGARLTGRVVEASTAGSGAPNLLAATESRKLLTNEGATAENYHTLPAAAPGIEFAFYCQDADGIRIVAGAGDTIRLAASVSAAAGFVRCSTVGNALILTCINATEWVALSIVGTWLVDA